MAPSLDDRFTDSARWGPEAAAVRAILLECGLSEEQKWGKPCYSGEGNNIAILQKMNAFLALMFFKGALLDDPDGLLQSQGEATRSAKRLCFTSVEEVAELAPTIKHLVTSALAVEREGITLPPAPQLVLVAELQERLDAEPALKAAFEQLTPGRQRAYHLHISGAKQSKTRAKRVADHVDRILAGKGLRDR